MLLYENSPFQQILMFLAERDSEIWCKTCGQEENDQSAGGHLQTDAPMCV